MRTDIPFRRGSFILVALLLLGCSGEQNMGSAPSVASNRIQVIGGVPGAVALKSISVVHDDQRNVTCWIYGLSEWRPAISCLPDSLLEVRP